ncbi:GGDEF domain-containing protein [Thalassotalea ponticola]|uniref:EAL domain-containing protein n=1 Tax=Thalassotalea ponticola TaxID=1523392 RepID=UPI0025B48C2F|nr:GGDEF domain-containing protein [Thalassotalea ponticola]MDN3652189.1 GGDEF domain-containing protein [Thalassotalea ponticola]
MSSFSRIFFKNLLITVIVAIAYAIFSMYSLKGFVEGAQSDHKTTLNKLIQNYTGDNVKAFAKELKLTFDYDQLNITDLNNQPIYSYRNARAGTSPLSLFGADIEPTRIVNDNVGIKVLFKTNNDALYNVFYKITVFIAAVGLLLLFASSLITSKMVSRAYRKASQKLSQNIASDIKTAIENRDTGTQLSLPTEFSDVNNVLVELKTFIAQKVIRTQQLEQTAYVDPLTELENRSGFIDYFDTYSKTHGASFFGVLVVTRSSELSTINKVHGYMEGDRYICQIANILKSHCKHIEGAKVYRLNGSDFATFLPNTTLKVAQSYCDELTGLFNEYQQLTDYDSIAYSGLVNLDTKRPLGEHLALADSAISMAQTRNKNSWYAPSKSALQEQERGALGNQNWSKEIDFVIENQSVKLLGQLIQPSGRNNRIYHEVLSRFTSSEGDILPTATFIAMAEKLDKMVLIDRLVIEKTLSEIKSKNLTKQMFGINLSIRSIHDEHFVIWLERRLLKEHDIAARLVFEVSEFGLEQNIRGSKYFIDMAHRIGSRICVERFGLGMTSFKFFNELQPDYVKMDGSYTRDLHLSKNNQYFLRLMIDLAHRLGVRVLAESVETQEEKYALDEIFVDGSQGYYLGKPEAL